METNIDKRAQNVVQLLNKYNYHAATAESCTGGMISAAITSVSGASAVFDMGVCTYANSAKNRLLGVRSETLEKHGAVSEQTACEMAEGIRKAADADFGVSVTGIAGPTGEVEGKPVGTVYIGISTKEKTNAELFVFDTDDADIRAAVRRQTTEKALELLEAAINKTQSERN